MSVKHLRIGHLINKKSGFFRYFPPEKSKTGTGSMDGHGIVIQLGGVLVPQAHIIVTAHIHITTY